MKRLRPKIIRYLTVITLTMMALILAGMIFLELQSVAHRTTDNARQIFVQIHQILEQNEEDLAEAQAQYSELCLANAGTIAYILEENPEIIENRNLEELLKIAKYVQVDEIHLFDENGVIFFGTQPEYFGYSFDSGEQIGFFKPMLSDHSLRMLQDITPNTAAGKMVQYSALWSENEKFIVEIGMYPETVLKAREKNELSYIFSLLKANAGIDLFASDSATGTVLGCTNPQYNGKSLTELGLPEPDQITPDRGFTTRVNGIQNFAVFTREGGWLIGYTIPTSVMYSDAILTCLIFGLGLLLIAFVMVLLVSRFMGTYVIDDIQRTNEKLTRITEGDLGVTVDIQSSLEFSELSHHINTMVHSLVESRKQIERERDLDLLTGLYNRRGLDNEIAHLRAAGRDLGCYAVIMVDADGLKAINDRFGHENGDLYLRRMAEALRSVGIRESVCARQGGDEFVLFLCGYENEALLSGTVENLRRLQDGQMVELQSGVIVELQFSVGCSAGSGELDFEARLKEADAAMYSNKRERHCRI